LKWKRCPIGEASGGIALIASVVTTGTEFFSIPRGSKQHQAIRIRDWQFFEQYCIDDAKQRCVCSHTECDSQDGNDREARMLEEHL